MAITIENIELEQLLPVLSSPAWSTGPLYFVGDVGGTNARLGFGHDGSGANGAQPGVHIVFLHFAMTRKDAAQLLDFFQTILHVIDPSSRGGQAGAGDHPILSRIVSGALSIPGPVTSSGTVGGPFNSIKGVMHMDAFPAVFFPTTPSPRFHMERRSTLLNDLEAGGYGVLAVNDARVFDEYFTLMWAGTAGGEGAMALDKGDCFVAAPGTGLGTSLLHRVPQATHTSTAITTTPNKQDATTEKADTAVDPFQVISLQIGSMTLPFRRGVEGYYMALSEFIHGRRRSMNAGGDTVRVPVCENGCCGGAIVYNYLLAKRAEKARGEASSPLPASMKDAGITPGEVVKLAKEKKDPAALAALTRAYQSLMWTCSEAAMMFLPRTVVIVGDNIVHNAFLFEDEARLRSLRAACFEHSMQDAGFVGRATFLRQSKRLNLNLLGCFGFGVRSTTGTATSGVTPTAARTTPSKL